MMRYQMLLVFLLVIVLYHALWDFLNDDEEVSDHIFKVLFGERRHSGI